jgi:hypothetical protein
VFIILKSVKAEGDKSSSANMAVLNGHIPVTKNSDWMFPDESAFGSEWFTTDGMS